MHSSSVALVPVAVGVLVGAGNRPLVGGGGDADAGSHAPRLKAAPARRGIQMNPSWHSQLPSSGWHCPRPAPQRTSLLQVPQPSPDHPWTQLQSVPPTSVDTAMFWCITSSARLAVALSWASTSCWVSIRTCSTSADAPRSHTLTTTALTLLMVLPVWITAPFQVHQTSSSAVRESTHSVQTVLEGHTPRCRHPELCCRVKVHPGVPTRGGETDADAAGHRRASELLTF